MVRIDITKEELEKLEKQFPQIDIVKMVSRHSPIYHGNIYPMDGSTKPLHDVYFYFDREKVYTLHGGFVWIATEDKIYAKILDVISVTEDGKIKIESGKKHYFGLDK